ncbi:MAG TPA: hydrogenase maturation protease [Rhodospirillaceae bacterium]|nr:hydrogenase maturation protease [Rhodospirillaceae bacterium]
MDGTLVIGIGNPWRRDDGAGPAVAARLDGRARTLTLLGSGADLIEAWHDAKRVVVIDAMRSGASPGTLRRFDAQAGPLPAGAFRCLGHRFGLPEAIEMARVLGCLPSRLEVWGIEAGDLGRGPGLTAEVEEAVSRLADELAPMI